MSVVYFAANGLCAYAPETHFWAERRKQASRHRFPRTTPALFSTFPGNVPPGPPFDLRSPCPAPWAEDLPLNFVQKNETLLSALAHSDGTVRKIRLPPAAVPPRAVVVHIQDVHGNKEVQRNIGATVERLATEGQMDLLALEGAWGPITLQPFREFPHRQVVRQAADSLLDENKISGPIHAVLTGTGPFCPVVGIDRPDHYNANVDAYRRSVPRLADAQGVIRAGAEKLEQRKKILFSTALMEFDERVEAYRARRISLDEFLRAALSLSPPPSVSPTLRQYAAVVEMERKMDFNQVELERNAMLERLSGQLSADERNTLLMSTVAGRSHSLIPSEFYRTLTRLCEKVKIPLHSFPALDAYIRYVLLVGKVNPESFSREILSLEKGTYQRLAKSPEEQRLVLQARSMYLTEKLVAFRLTPTEWVEYSALPPEVVSPLTKGLALEPFESFYREANLRDRGMAVDLLQALDESRGRVAVLVAGGFHAEGLAEHLASSGVAVISFVPRIEIGEADQGSVALSVFTQEKSPLERLFQGENHFLANPPVRPWVARTLLPLWVTVGTLFLVGRTPNMDPQTLYAGLGGVGTLTVIELLRDHARVRLAGKKNKNNVFLWFSKGTSGVKAVAQSRSAIVQWPGEMWRRAKNAFGLWHQTRFFFKGPFSAADGVSFTSVAVGCMVLAIVAAGAIALDWSMGQSAVGQGMALVAAVSAKPVRRFDVKEIFDFYRVFRKGIPYQFLFKPYLQEDLNEDLSLSDVVARALKLNPVLEDFFLVEDEKLDLLRFIEALNNYIFLPAGFCLGDISMFDKPLRINEESWLSLPFLGGTIRVATVINVGRKKGASITPATAGSLSGAIFLDPAAAQEKIDALWQIYQVNHLSGKNRRFREKLRDARLEKRDLVYATLDWHARISIARVKQSIFTARIKDLSLYEATGEVLSDSILKPDSSLRSLFPSPATSGDSAAPLTHEEGALPVVLQLLEGTIEHLYHMRLFYGSPEGEGEAKAQLLGTLAIIEIMRIANGNNPIFWKIGSRRLVDLLKAEVFGPASSRNPSDDDLSMEFLDGALDSYEKLIAVLENIRQANLVLPEERFYHLYGRPPNSVELRELNTEMRVVKYGAGQRETLRRTPPVLGGPSALVQDLVARSSTVDLPETEEGRNKKRFLKDSSDLFDRYAAGQSTLEGFNQLHRELSGGDTPETGFRQRAQSLRGDRDAREISALMEDLLVSVARTVFDSLVSRHESLLELGTPDAAIREILLLQNNENFMESLGGERAGALEDFLETDRVTLAGKDPSSFLNGGNPTPAADLFGLDDQEVALLSDLSKGPVAVDQCHFDRWALSQLKKKLGRFSPRGIDELIRQVSERNPPLSEGEIVHLEGYEIFLSGDIKAPMWAPLSAEILREISDGLRQCEQDKVNRQREEINPLASGLALSGRPLKGIQRGYAQGRSLRVYFRLFNERGENGNARKVLAIIDIENKGNTSTGPTGKIDSDLVEKLVPFARASSFGNPLFRKFRPLLRSSLKGKEWPSERGAASLGMVGVVFAATLLGVSFYSAGWAPAVMGAVLGLLGTFVLGQDLVRGVGDQVGRLFLGRRMALREMGLNMDFARGRYLVARLWGAEAVEDPASVPVGLGARPLTVLYLDRTTLPFFDRYSPGVGQLVVVPTDEEARAGVSAFRPDPNVMILSSIGSGKRGAGRTDQAPSLAEVEKRLLTDGVDFRHYTGCRVVGPLGMALNVEGVKSDLFRQALIVLLNGLTAVFIQRQDLRLIDLVARAVASAA